MAKSYPDKAGYFKNYGGRFVSELLMPALEELEESYKKLKKNKEFKKELKYYLNQYAGRPTLLFCAKNLSKKWGAKVYLKREDLLHTGAHKINNTIGQALMAKYMKKKRIIAETGAGQHGVATATVCALLKLPCTVYMGTEDLRRQALNHFRMQLLGAEVKGIGGNQGTLRDAVNEALRDWSRTVDDTHYIIGSVVGPHPFPMIVRDFQKIIGQETRKQIVRAEKKLPDAIFACVGGGSNAIGFFHGFLDVYKKVKIYGVEAGGHGLKYGEHSATLSMGAPGILQGSMSYTLQDKNGMISDVHSVSAGLDYPGVGPEHSYLKDEKMVHYISVTDQYALEGFQELSKEEGIIPALETSHAVAYAKEWVKKQKKAKKGKKPLIVINVSGRGDKDVAEAQRIISS